MDLLSATKLSQPRSEFIEARAAQRSFRNARVITADRTASKTM
jgi:hypothetical protein